MMRARSDTLKLQWREFGCEDLKICKMCKKEVESLQHFLIDCDKLQDIRDEYIELQRPVIQNVSDIMRNLLLFNQVDDKTEYYLDIVNRLWNKREERTKE